MIRLKEKATPEAVDALTVSEELRRAGELEKAGGEAYLHSLPTVVPAVGAVLDYARIVKEHALLRSVLKATREIQDDVAAHRGDARELIERAEAGPVQDRPRRRHVGDALARGDPPRRDRQARGALEDRRRAHRHAVRLHATSTRSPAASSPAT